MENVRSVERAIKILKAIGIAKNGLNISEIAARVNLHTTTVIRLLATLEREGFVSRDRETLAYRLGDSFIEMATNTLRIGNFYNVAYPVMQELVEECKETVALFVMNGTKRVCVEKIEGLHPIRWHIEIGDTAPLGISSSGKLLLAYAPQQLINSILEKPLFRRDGSRVDAEKLKTELEMIRAQGYATSFCENTEDGAGISAPIKNPLGKVIAALAILGPVNRINAEKVGSYKDMLISAADKISSGLGCNDCMLASRT